MSQPDLEDAQSTFSGTREVDPRYALDEARLGEWLAAHVEDYAGPLSRVRPVIVPRASGSHQGAPRPVKPGTR